MPGSSVQVTFGANIQPLIDDVNAVRSQIQSLAESVSGLSKTFITGFAIDKIAEAVESYAKLGRSVEEASAALGLSEKQVQTYGVAEQLAGEESGNLTRDFVTLSRNLEMASNASTVQARALGVLHLSARELLSLPMSEAFEKVSVAIEQYRGGASKAALSSALFGRNLQEMLPLIEAAANHFQEANEVGARTGAVFSDAMIAKFSDLWKQVTEMGLAFKGLGGTLTDIFGGAISGLLQIINDLIESFTRASAAGGSLNLIWQALAAAVDLVNVALAVAIGVVEAFWQVCVTAAEDVATIFNGLGRVMYDAFTFNWSDISAAWGDFKAQMAAHGKELTDNLAGDVKQAVDEIKATLGLAFTPPSGTDNRPNAPSFSGANDAIKAQAEQYQALVKAAQEAYATTTKLAEDAYSQAKEHLTAQAKDGQITYRQETAALLAELDKRLAAQTDALNKEYAAEAAALQQKLALYPKGSAQWQAALDEQKAAYQKYQDDLAKIDSKWKVDHQKIVDDAMQHDVQKWQSALGTIESSFNSQLRGLLAGTTTWSQAWKKMLGDMIIKWIEMCEQMLVKWLATELAKTTATTTGAAARTAAEESASSAGMLGMVANAIKAIMTDAAQVFGGVFAFLAPTMGPAAAGPAAAAQASVSAAAIFDVGTDYVVRGGLALIHPGETIIPPARGSGPFTGAGMGATVHAPVSINVSALDSQSVKRFFDDNSHHLLRAINDAVKRGAHLGLRAAHA